MKFQFLIFLLLFGSCSSNQRLIKNNVFYYANSNEIQTIGEISIFQTDHLNENKKDHQNHFMIYTGNVLLENLSTHENIERIKKLELSHFDLIHLNYEDIAIAKMKDIKFETFSSLQFLNTTVININDDEPYNEKNVAPFYKYQNTIFLNLSNQVSKNFTLQPELLLQDPILSLLKIKKILQKSNEKETIKSFFVVQNIKDQLQLILTRAPSTFFENLSEKK